MVLWLGTALNNTLNTSSTHPFEAFRAHDEEHFEHSLKYCIDNKRDNSNRQHDVDVHGYYLLQMNNLAVKRFELSNFATKMYSKLLQLNIRISQSNAAADLRRVRKLYNNFFHALSQNAAAKELCKSVQMCQ